MKNILLKTRALLLVLLTSASAYAGSPNAHVQIFHNCADPLAANVSVYADFGFGQQLIDNNFAFREATAFLSVPSGVAITAYVKAPGASASDPAIYSQVLPALAPDSSYILVASGVVGSGFAANPNSLSTAFSIKILAPARRTAFAAGKVEFAVFHGATDAPAVDVNISNGGPTLVSNAAYGDASPYLSVNPTWYAIDVAPAGNATPVASYVADLTTLGGGSAVVFASGFLTPLNNNNGAAFGLFAVLADGTVIELPQQTNANVQVIHNCADPAADSVDVYVDGTLALDNFKFRTATPFIPLLAGVNHSIAVAPASSTSVGDALATFNGINLTANENYTVIASGVVLGGFAANPNSLSTAFDLKVLPNARNTGSNGSLIDFNVFHGATDAPGVDVRVRSGGPLLVNNAKYGDATAYLGVPPTYYQLEVLTEDSATVVNTWIANLSGLQGRAATVFASGFLTPSANNNGAAFGLFAALDNGTVVAFPIRTTAGFQLVHNAADPAVDSVDVYVNGAKFFDNFKFRTASPLIQGVLTAGFPQQIGIAPGNSTSVNDTVWSATLFFNTNQNYVAIASGVVGTGFAANPDSRSTAFDVLVKTPSQTLAGNGTDFDFFVVHGATDAPTVDVKVQGGPTIVDNAAYSDMTGYLPVPAASYVVDLQDGTGTTTIASYVADLSTLGGQAGIVLASGFLTPSANNNGKPFGLFLVTNQGGPFVPLPLYNSISEEAAAIGLNMFPNPSNGTLFINFDLNETENVTVNITDLNGRVVKQVLNNSSLNGRQNLTADLSDLSNGMYMARIITSTKSVNSKFTLNR
ncbi:MAG: DUF4397 domain-containing protein [Chitinophagales bacterium]